jgi:hypothetical protein
MLAGAVSFLYSIPCDSFQTLLQQDPTKAILAIKEIIMLTTDMRSNLMSRTVSEGRLNMFKAATQHFRRGLIAVVIWLSTKSHTLVTTLWSITFLDLKTNLIYKYMIWMENPY